MKKIPYNRVTETNTSQNDFTKTHNKIYNENKYHKTYNKSTPHKYLTSTNNKNTQ